jgi:Tfp pilus assembly protein PilF
VAISHNQETVPSAAELANDRHAWGGWRRRTVGALLVVVTLVAYARLWNASFIHFDDPSYITENKHVLRGLSWENVVWAWTTYEQSNWHPLTWLSHMADVQCFGLNARMHHLVNLLLHVGSTLLLFAILAEMTGAVWCAAFVAALFAVHPMHVESVAWIAERKDVLSTFLGLLALGAYQRYVRRPGVWRYLAVFVLLALSLTAKPMLVTFPCLLLLLDYWPLRRLPAGIVWRSAATGRLILEKVPLLGLSAASSFFTYRAQHYGGSVADFQLLTLGIRVENILVSYGRYLGKMVWPRNLEILYLYQVENWVTVWTATAVLLIISASVIWLTWRGKRYLLVGWLWFLGTLVPVIGVVQVGEQSIADRYSYFPYIGLWIMVAWGLADLAGQWRAARVATIAGAAAAIGICLVLTIIQVGYWLDPGAPMQHAVDVTPGNYVARKHLGLYLWTQKKYDEAMEQWKKALEACPYYVYALNDYGWGLKSRGQFAQAQKFFEEAVHYAPEYATAHNNLGDVLWKQGKHEEAIVQWRAALDVFPAYADAHNNLGTALRDMGRTAEAIQCFQKALYYAPQHVDAHNNLGVQLWKAGRQEEAIVQWRAALDADSTHADTLNNLACAVKDRGQVEEARTLFTAALRSNPDHADAHNNLGGILYAEGNREGAMDHWRSAIKIRPTYADAHMNLGVAFWQQQKFPEALAAFQDALHVQPDHVATHLNLGLMFSQLGQLEPAARELREVLRLQPGQAIAAAELEKVLLRQDKPAAAAPTGGRGP